MRGCVREHEMRGSVSDGKVVEGKGGENEPNLRPCCKNRQLRPNHSVLSVYPYDSSKVLLTWINGNPGRSRDAVERDTATLGNLLITTNVVGQREKVYLCYMKSADMCLGSYLNAIQCDGKFVVVPVYIVK